MQIDDQPSESLSGALSVWLLTPLFWVVIAVLFLGLEMINRRLVLFLPVAVASLVIAAMVQPMPADWPQLGFMPQSWPGILALWALMSLLGSTLCMMIRRRVMPQTVRRRRLTRAVVIPRRCRTFLHSHPLVGHPWPSSQGIRNKTRH